MWRGMQAVPYNTQSEVLVRMVLLLIVCMMHVNIEPHTHIITDAEMNAYKRSRQDSLIPPWAMVLLVVCVPLFFLSLPSIFTGTYMDLSQSLLAWTLAFAINAFITESGKLIVGRPRPDFFYRCYPDGKVPKDVQCTGVIKEIMEGRKSFPSGHSSFSFCSLGFISVWLCGKLKVLARNRGEGLRVVTCLVPLVLAGVVAMSRCCDNHHHWEDVFAGAIIGLTSSYFCYRQYYYALDSELSGCPYKRTVEEIVRNTLSSHQCCTRDLVPAASVCSKSRE